jgi:hypothetical protein
MANTIGILDVSVGGCFGGIGDLFVFDSMTDAQYATAKLSTFTNGMAVRPIYDGTTAWTGGEPTLTQLKDEDGKVICSYSEGGSNSFEVVLMQLNAAVVKKFLNGIQITDASLNSSTWIASADILGIDGNYYTSVMPTAMVDKSKGVAVIFPRALCTASLVAQDGGIGLKLSFEALDINTANLKQLMIARNGLPNYTA